jgi:hypothetical protein
MFVRKKINIVHSSLDKIIKSHKKALYIVDCRDEIISKSAYLWAL